jgi:NTE family protein
MSKKSNDKKLETSLSAPSESKKDYFCPLPDKKDGCRPVNLAIQGGGTHGAFAWGVIDRLLEDGRLHIEGISGTSAGSMNAVVLAYGLLIGGYDGARQKLHDFWRAISERGQLYNPCKQTSAEKFWFGNNMDQSSAFLFFEALTRWFSPYQLNPLDFNPLKDILNAQVDFEHLQTCQVTKLFLSATNVRTGQVRVFRTDEVNCDVVMASACLPTIFKAVEIDGEYYWDGGYTGNPSLFPFFYHVESADILIIHINPIERPAPPTLPTEIFNRINEISFNSALLKEFRAIEFVHKLLDENWLKDEYRNKLKYVFLHSISANTALNDLSAANKMSSDWDFIQLLFNRGRAHANEWLAHNFNNLGVKSSVDLKAELVNLRKKNTSITNQKNL